MVHIIDIGCVQNCHKAVEFYLKNEFFDIFQLLSKPSKYSFGSKLKSVSLEFLRMSFFKILPPRAPKRPILVQFSQTCLRQIYAQPISITNTILDSGGKWLSIKNVAAKLRNSTHSNVSQSIQYVCVQKLFHTLYVQNLRQTK